MPNPTANISVPRRRSVDVGGLALALGDQTQGSGHGWGGWDENETGETRYAEVLIDVRAHTESIVNPSYDGISSPSVSSFLPSLPASPNPSTPQAGVHPYTTQPANLSSGHLSDPVRPPANASPNAHDTEVPPSRYHGYPPPFHVLADDTTRERLIESLSSWYFEPHRLSSDEVLSCTLLLFEAYLSGIPGQNVGGVFLDQLPAFLYHLQTIYRQANTYHNFEHALDVFQALYHFLSEAGAVRPVRSLLGGAVPANSNPSRHSPSLLDSLTKEDIFALCIAAVGHDVGHPGLTNAFMKNAQTPLSVLYDDKSVLEQMHYALILKVMKHTGLGVLLRRSSSGDQVDLECKQLLLSTILVTDLNVHDQFMGDFAKLIEGDILDPFKAKLLVCQALIKCADISNPARPYTVSQHWAAALSSEWSSQVILEKHLHLPSSVYPSVNALGEAKGQTFFIERFAGPLFDLIGKGFPPLKKFSQQCRENLKVWQERAEKFSKEEQASKGEGRDTGQPAIDPRPDKPYAICFSRVTSPEDFLSAFPPTLPKSFLSPSSSNSDADEEETRSPIVVPDIPILSQRQRHRTRPSLGGNEQEGRSQGDDDGGSVSGSSYYETCASASPPMSPMSFPPERPSRLEITTLSPAQPQPSGSQSQSQRLPGPSSSSVQSLVSPLSSYHQSPSFASLQTSHSGMSTPSSTVNATAAIRAAYRASVRKKPSARSFNRSSWNPPPTDYDPFAVNPVITGPSPISTTASTSSENLGVESTPQTETPTPTTVQHPNSRDAELRPLPLGPLEQPEPRTAVPTNTPTPGLSPSHLTPSRYQKDYTRPGFPPAPRSG